MILKFTMNGVRQWATFYGGHVNTEGWSIAGDGVSIWVAGRTESEDFPVQNPGAGAFYQPHNSALPNVISESWDIMWLQFTTACVRVWATNYGDVEDDFGTSIYYDGTYLWVAGETRSPGDSLVNPGGGAYFQSTCASCGVVGDGVIIKLGIPTIPLPIELLWFEAKADEGTHSVQCEWATATEQNNDHFTVERSQAGSQFAAIGMIPGAGTSQSSISYQLEDPSPLSGLAYYRLRQTDIDGCSTLSAVVPVRMGSGTSVS